MTRKFDNGTFARERGIVGIMALYNQLPVYKASYDLLVELFRFVKDFSREYKCTLGESIKKETIAMITHIYRANGSQNKGELIQAARENVETIRLYLRLTKDLRQIGSESITIHRFPVERKHGDAD